ncbi:MAG: RagB/SusD family nutrient uptake outer membrane protein [Cyclobacteriaceae bacterium]|nr:RagB/SusD family nutrient uptake outer membrane protein [Cyclobacteriaceae bacterium]
MKSIFQYIFIGLLVFMSFGCEDYLEPLDENLSSEDRLLFDPAFAEGVLLNSYIEMFDYFGMGNVNTDDAVANNLDNFNRRMAIGEWRADNNPMSRWNKYESVFFINRFISSIDNVQWKRDEVTNELFKMRLSGEAYAMRAIFHYFILQAHAGKSDGGELLGIPYYDVFIPTDGDFNLPRLTFQQTLDRIDEDLNAALELLPLDYSDSPDAVPPHYQSYSFDTYKFVFGALNKGRVDGRCVKAFQAKLYLLAASPAYLNGAGYWEKAAEKAAAILADKGGLSYLDPLGGVYYAQNEATMLSLKELMWRGSVYTGAWVEEAQLPPSLNGRAETNPTQDLVDAFPMADGTPIGMSTAYDPNMPYTARDPRLARYILYNGNEIGGRVIYTGKGAGINTVDSIASLSTRSGYYLKKLLQPNVVISNDGTVTSVPRTNVFLRYTDIFLVLAEAANEAGGPDFTVEGMSARNILAAIRQRAGITGDSYLASISSKEEMRNLIQNERRIELCFEGQRFWDMRRWELDLNESLQGIYHNGSSYQYFKVEDRVYPPHGIYGPIPYLETIKFNALKQNAGW